MVPEDADVDHPALYFNRELGWLDFNWRVLHQARDPRVPLLERVRFLAIAASNLDEFFQKRVGGLKRQEVAGVLTLSHDGRHPRDQLRLIRDAVLVMHRALSESWSGELRPLLRSEAGVVVSDYSGLSSTQQAELREFFRDHIYPVLTPLAVDPGHPFPFISNLSLSLAVVLRHPARDTLHFARVKVPTNTGRWLRVPESPHRFHFVPLEQVIRFNAEELFRGMELVSVHAFRFTRNADVKRDDDEVEDLLAVMSGELRERCFAPGVRLEVEQAMPEQLRQLLLRELELQPEDVYETEGLLALSDCAELADLDLPEHRYTPWEPVVPEPFLHEGESEEEQNVFAIIRRGEILVHHPYDSFTASVQRLLEEAAADPQVVAIKQTLYRTSENSPIVNALVRAAERGKQVAVLVEVSARFDEANNIEWAQVLEDAGVHVTYGVVGLKTHSKVTLIVRYEEGRPRTYCHVGTGNYHARTTRLYTDLGLLTCDREIGADLVNLFHFLTGYAPDQQYSRLVVAPREMRRTFEELIRREVEIQGEQGQGLIIAKLNALDDAGIIQELYRASQAGVRVDLIIRGHSRLRPGLPGYSETIRVRSILGRFLEHDRIFYFHNGGEPKIFIGSADWRQRNLNERVEAMVPVSNPALQRRLIGILDQAMADNRLAWELQPDGHYIQCHPLGEEAEINFQEQLMQSALERTQRGTQLWGMRLTSPSE
ncbi:MAG: polyphosphate kinase 1 [Gemmatimonadota bacterium]|nr:polyphosphate kinase 1 [Gemmatimonadota bacterium]